MTLSLTLALLLSMLAPQGPAHNPKLDFSAKLYTRELRQGKRAEASCELLLRANGSSVVHFTSPAEYYLLSNEAGDVQFYNPVTHVVRMERLPLAGSAHSLIRFFMDEETSTMGLDDAGYSVSEVKNESGPDVVEWENTRDPSSAVHRVQLVYLKEQLCYMRYLNRENQVIYNCHFGSFVSMGDVQLPSRITETTFFSEGDSLIIDNRFSEMALGEGINAELASFEIPDDATLE